MTNRQRWLLVVIMLIAVFGIVLASGMSAPEPPATLWYCAATGEVRETAAGVALAGYQAEGGHAPGQPLRLTRSRSMMERLQNSVRGKEGRRVYRFGPTGAVVTENSDSWAEFRIERE